LLLWHVTRVYPLWYLNRTLGPEDAAVLAAIRQVCTIVVIIATAVVTVVLTVVAKTWESRGPQEADRQWRLSFKTTSLALLLFSLCVALLRRPLVAIFEEHYAVGADIVPACLLMFLLTGNLRFLTIHFHLILKTRWVFVPWGLGAVSSLLLARWLIAPHRLGQVGAGLESIRPWLEPWLNLWPSSGLASAAWAGMLSFWVVTIACLVFLRIEGRRLDRGSVLLVWSPACLCLRSGGLAVALVVLIALALLTPIVFSGQERRELRQRVRNLRPREWLTGQDAD
jgi:O-antigen/teichoic acid export membrane protein